jgi:hypothetical protein
MTRIVEALAIDAQSTIARLRSLELAYPAMRRIDVFLDNARYHHAKLVKEWLNHPGRRIVLHFVPAYCPHLNPIERLWFVMHKAVTHRRSFAKFRDYAEGHAQLPAAGSAAQLRPVLIDHHRQFPRHRSKGPPDPRVTSLY